VRELPLVEQRDRQRGLGGALSGKRAFRAFTSRLADQFYQSGAEWISG
jgi:hypothetical protein